ncbi:DNA polymerase III subunit gamma/tau [Vreelandella neptunia]|uniref:DNA polymerase III subunit gamma/tau n=1 Tax=Vreelandella neptunia TaxID=115551 RepID=A0ABZ0YFY4_9GAMM|nr:DNA polymerase III subunit gamma/tau [Halomonas neptunia]MDN3561407.1 DNA polymerase III subunit gamma/tau [Halomonas neptunia]TDV93623.1 DNA polymerase-3 subunit gamma/tau [Halomonas alkaliantarctica]WQH11009.1 DNA polymerase III subunit gamma/tau [Halomonas neptunia]
MSYQVLARKWRPRTFHELVGQAHVQRALVNALDQGRLHHAYLFTGTRGVGKTTLARILAKCLNCTANGRGDEGITSTPCGQCDSCQAIDEGRFVDLIEVDAASRTKVEDTRELLDNVQYAPTQGRYKVYLIDEVHMLSTSSFNALLKTLEEPPPHVKFLLATTDPQKLPPTVLSRCLQFTLKHMPPERVVEHLTYVLGEEGVAFDESALWLLGKAAEGSMRDAMSLTDQAIAFGQGAVRHADVAAMLGTLDHRHILGLAEALADVDVQRLLAEVAELAEQGPDFAAVLDELSSMLHRLAVAQMVPDAVDNSHGDRDVILQLASRFTAEDIQLYYQIGIQGRGDMVHAPDLRSALEMTLLRMLAFRPQGVPKPPRTPLPLRREPSQAETTEKGVQAPVAEAPSTAPQPAAAVDATAEVHSAPDAQPEPPLAPSPEQAAPAAEEEPPLQEPPPWTVEAEERLIEGGTHQQVPEPTVKTEPELATEPQPVTEPEPTAAPAPASEPQTVEPSATVAPEAAPEVVPEALSETLPETSPQNRSEIQSGKLDNAQWLQCFDSLGLGGLTRNLAGNCLVESDDGTLLTLRLDPSQEAMQAEVHQTRIERALKEQGMPRRIAFYVAELSNSLETPRQREERLNQERHAQAVDLLNHDPHVQKLQQAFGAKLIESSVKPADAVR